MPAEQRRNPHLHKNPRNVCSFTTGLKHYIPSWAGGPSGPSHRVSGGRGAGALAPSPPPPRPEDVSSGLAPRRDKRRGPRTHSDATLQRKLWGLWVRVPMCLLSVCVSVYVCVSVSVSVCACLYACVSSCLCVSVFASVFIFMCVCVYMCLYLCICVCFCVCLHICVYVYLCVRI